MKGLPLVLRCAIAGCRNNQEQQLQREAQEKFLRKDGIIVEKTHPRGRVNWSEIVDEDQYRTVASTAIITPTTREKQRNASVIGGYP